MQYISTEEKIHHSLQIQGFRYCPLDETQDSQTLPPTAEKTCNHDFKAGYYLYKEDNILFVMYNTRCMCTRMFPSLYCEIAEKYLKSCLPSIWKICPEALISYSQKGRPYIRTNARNKISAVETFEYLLSSPYTSFHPLKETTEK